MAAWAAAGGLGSVVSAAGGFGDPGLYFVMLHVRGGGDGAVEAVHLVAGALDADPIDMSTGAPAVPAGWEEWQLYRDRTIGQ